MQTLLLNSKRKFYKLIPAIPSLSSSSRSHSFLSSKLKLLRSVYIFSNFNFFLIKKLNFSSMSFIQRINPLTGQAEWVNEPENYDYHQEIARSAYADMLHDHDRNMKYYRGLELAIKELHNKNQRAIVLDIGTGTGLLSMMAAKLGAEEIYACEAFSPMAKCAGEVIKQNGFSDRIKLIPKRSTDLLIGKDMSSRANILVTEVFDTELIGEGAIETFNHAHTHLLEEGSYVIPTKAFYYAMVVDCPMVTSWNTLENLNFPNGTTHQFPPSISACAGVPSVHDVQLSEIKKENFTQLSDPIKIFEFDFGEHTSKLPTFRSSFTNFTCSSNGNFRAVFTWWDLVMSPLDSSTNPQNIISMRPSWGYASTEKNNYAWRDHWMQSIYYIPSPTNLIEGKNSTPYTLCSYHDEFSFWFDVKHFENENLKNNSECQNGQVIQRPVCECGIHLGLSRARIGLFNDSQRNTKWMKILEKVLTPESICLVLSEGSSLGFILEGLGAKEIYILESNSFCRRAMESLVKGLKNGHSVKIIESLDEVLKSDIKFDIVVGDPFFHDSVLPWHNLFFWYCLEKLRGHLAPNSHVFPNEGSVKGVGVEFRDLWKIRSRVGKVCNGDFSIQDFDDLIEKSSDKSDADIDAQPLWEYPSTASSAPFTLFNFDLRGNVKNQTNSELIELSKKSNGICLWTQWNLDEDTILSTGPIETIKIGEEVKWDKNSKQGVYFLPNGNEYAKLYAKAFFRNKDGIIKFSFTAL